jgi:hypothetical protein
MGFCQTEPVRGQAQTNFEKHSPCRVVEVVPHDGLHNDHDGDDSRTGFAWIEIYTNGLCWEKQAGLVATEAYSDWRSAFEKSHKRDLNVSIHVTELHEADDSLECGRSSEARVDENIATSRGMEQR